MAGIIERTKEICKEFDDRSISVGLLFARLELAKSLAETEARLAKRDAVLKWLANEACQECGAGDTCDCVTCMTETAKAALAGKEKEDA